MFRREYFEATGINLARPYGIKVKKRKATPEHPLTVEKRVWNGLKYAEEVEEAE